MSKLQDDIRALCDLTAEAPGLEPLSPTGGPLSPEPRRSPHEAGCWCTDCWQAGLEVADYLQKKRIIDANGF